MFLVSLVKAFKYGQVREQSHCLLAFEACWCNHTWFFSAQNRKSCCPHDQLFVNFELSDSTPVPLCALRLVFVLPYLTSKRFVPGATVFLPPEKKNYPGVFRWMVLRDRDTPLCWKKKQLKKCSKISDKIYHGQYNVFILVFRSSHLCTFPITL